MRNGAQPSAVKVATEVLLKHNPNAKACFQILNYFERWWYLISRWVAPTIERIDLGCGSNLMLVLINFTIPAGCWWPYTSSV